MAGEIQIAFGKTGAVVYVQVRNDAGQIWNTNTAAFESYLTANLSQYSVSTTEQGVASGYYVGTFPAGITAPGVYYLTAKQRVGGAAAESDPVVAVGDFNWDGGAVQALASLASSGQVSQIGPMRIARGTMVTPFPVYFRQSADHVTPLTSGVVSGQIARDTGAFGPLQSGAFTEVGMGWYNLLALTSGDLLANVVKLQFTAVGISGGSADPVPLSFVLQRTSGQ